MVEPCCSGSHHSNHRGTRRTRDARPDRYGRPLVDRPPSRTSLCFPYNHRTSCLLRRRYACTYSPLGPSPAKLVLPTMVRSRAGLEELRLPTIHEGALDAELGLGRSRVWSCRSRAVRLLIGWLGIPELGVFTTCWLERRPVSELSQVHDKLKTTYLPTVVVVLPWCGRTRAMARIANTARVASERPTRR